MSAKSAFTITMTKIKGGQISIHTITFLAIKVIVIARNLIIKFSSFIIPAGIKVNSVKLLEKIPSCVTIETSALSPILNRKSLSNSLIRIMKNRIIL